LSSYPEDLQGDRGYVSEPVRQLLRGLAITPILPERCVEESGLGKLRWLEERTISWLHFFGRLRHRCTCQVQRVSKGEASCVAGRGSDGTDHGNVLWEENMCNGPFAG
jgi:hypothetical protein